MGLGEQYELEKTGSIYREEATVPVDVSKLLEDFYVRILESFNACVGDVHGFTIPEKADIIGKFLEDSHSNIQKLDAFSVLVGHLKKDFGNFDLNDPYQVANIVKRLVDDHYNPKDDDGQIERVKVMPGYEGLFRMLIKSLDQSQIGKGKERHADDNTFENQPICTEIPILGLGGPAYQVRKKCRESIGILKNKGPEAAIHEMCGVIVYAAAMMLYMESLMENK